MQEQRDESTGASAQILTGLLKLSLVLRHEAWQASGQRGLTPTQSQVLSLLVSRGPMSVSTVARHLAVTKGTASEAVSTLESKGLLRKEPDANDGRALMLRLTRKGRGEARRSIQWPDLVLAAVDSLPGTEQGAFLRGLTALVRSLQEQGAVPMSRMCAQCRFFTPNRYPARRKTHYCGFLQEAIGDAELRLDCDEMEPAADALQPLLAEALLAGTQLDSSLFDGGELDE